MSDPVLRLDQQEGTMLYTDVGGQSGGGKLTEEPVLAFLSVALVHGSQETGSMAYYRVTGTPWALCEALSKFLMANPGVSRMMQACCEFVDQQRAAQRPLS